MFYTVLQLGYAQKGGTYYLQLFYVVLTVAAIYWMYWIYKRELKQENDWFFMLNHTGIQKELLSQ